jgi:hypothetical protein
MVLRATDPAKKKIQQVERRRVGERDDVEVIGEEDGPEALRDLRFGLS